MAGAGAAAAATRLHLRLPFPAGAVEAVRHGLMFGIPPLILAALNLTLLGPRARLELLALALAAAMVVRVATLRLAAT